jgi:hypothetical protein
MTVDVAKASRLAQALVVVAQIVSPAIAHSV